MKCIICGKERKQALGIATESKIELDGGYNALVTLQPVYPACTKCVNEIIEKITKQLPSLTNPICGDYVNLKIVVE